MSESKSTELADAVVAWQRLPYGSDEEVAAWERFDALASDDANLLRLVIVRLAARLVTVEQGIVAVTR